MGRKQAREGTMQALYQMTLNKDFSEDALKLYLDNFTFEDSETKYIVAAIEKITENLESIDSFINENLQGWELDRLAKVDLSILRIAIYEILYRDDIPMQVSINEAIEISKKYSTEDSFRFINGVLGGFVRSLNKEE